jgi:Tol biopolymer transport system component
VRRKLRWLITDGLPIILGLVVLPSVAVALLIGYKPWRSLRPSIHVSSPISNIAHWWSCNSGATGTPTWSPDGREIAYATKGDCDTVIVVVRRDGSHRRVLSTTFADWPSWSPSGREILVRTHHGYGILSPTGRPIRQVYDSESDVGATWSPDGDEIAFTHGFLPGPGGDYESTLYIMSVEAKTPRRVIGHSCDPGAPAWSPDRSSLAVGCHDGLYVIDVATGARRRIVEEAFGFDPPTPSWSRDGRQLGYLDGDAGLYTVPADGSSQPRRLVAVESSSWADSVAWSPDGQSIAFSGSMGRHRDGIFVARTDGRGIRQVAHF